VAQNVRRDATAVAAVQAAIVAMQGTQQASSIGTAVLNGHATKYTNGQPSQQRFLTKYKVLDGTVAFRRELTSDQDTSVFASGGKRPVFQLPDGRSHRFGKHVAMAAPPFDLPLLVLWQIINNSLYEFILKNDSMPSIVHVQLENPSDPLMKKITRQDWYFDATTYLPLRVIYEVPDVTSPSTTIKANCDYLQFQPIDFGIVVPVQMKLYEEADLVEAITVDSVRINGTVEQDFDMPQGDN
jgi:hypothetical protein